MRKPTRWYVWFKVYLRSWAVYKEDETAESVCKQGHVPHAINHRYCSFHWTEITWISTGLESTITSDIMNSETCNQKRDEINVLP